MGGCWEVDAPTRNWGVSVLLVGCRFAIRWPKSRVPQKKVWLWGRDFFVQGWGWSLDKPLWKHVIGADKKGTLIFWGSLAFRTIEVLLFCLLLFTSGQ